MPHYLSPHDASILSAIARAEENTDMSDMQDRLETQIGQLVARVLQDDKPERISSGMKPLWEAAEKAAQAIRRSVGE